jgi:hypothetical protein
VATGHFEDNSALTDIVTADANGTVSVLLGKGDGTFGNPVNIHIGGSLTSVAVGDFLGKGVQDIVTANTNGTVNLLVSNGNGTFQSPQSFAVGATPVGVAVGDFNNDGKLDIVTANSNETVTVLLGTGPGTFQTPITSQLSDHLTSVAVGEFNGDGKPDVVVGTGSGVDVLQGDGAGAFQLKSTVPFVIHYANLLIPEVVTSVAVADFGRGEQDIVALADSEVSVALGNGDGTFQDRVLLNTGQSAISSFAVGDVTGDGKLDIVMSGFGAPFGGTPSIGVMAGNGDGTFATAQLQEIGVTANALALGDFNRDGKKDLAFASSFGSTDLAPLLNTGGGTFGTAPVSPTNILTSAAAVGDFNGDRKQDIVTTGIGGDAVVLLSNGDGTFRTDSTLTVPGSPDSVVVGDFNGDHKQDIAVGTEAGKIFLFLGNGDGSFQTAKVFNLGINQSVQSFVAGDFNRDGRLDLAVTSDNVTTGTGTVTVLLGNGNGTFRKAASIQVGTDAAGLAVGDLNGDGNLDLVTTSLLADGSRAVELLLGKGTGTFQAPISLTPGTRSESVAIGDFTGDGKLDLVLVDRFNNTVSVLPGNGDGTFGSILTTPVENPVAGLGGPALGDFFNDGKLSLAVTTGLGTVSVLRGNGDGTFQAQVDYLVGAHGTEPSTVVTGDFNGDGKPDLATTNFEGADVSVLLNTSPPPSHAAPISTVTSLKVDTKTATFGQSVTLTATVTSSDGVPTGTVTFFDGNQVLGEVALDPKGHASLTVTLDPGKHALRASFAGIAPFTDSASATLTETIKKASTTTALAVDIKAFGIQGLVLLTATVAPVAPGAGQPTGTITFREGTKVLLTTQLDANGQATLLLVDFPPGQHTVTASYSGDPDFNASVSDPVTFTLP